MRKLLAIMTIFLWCSISSAAEIQFGWNAATGGTNPPTGYKIYYGTVSNTYTNSVDMGLVLSGVVPSLTLGVTYYFAVVAYNGDGESSKSVEVSAVPTTLGVFPKAYSGTSYPR